MVYLSHLLLLTHESLYLKCLFTRQDKLCSNLLWNIFYLLIKPFIFKVIIEICGLILTMFVAAFCTLHFFFQSFSAVYGFLKSSRYPGICSMHFLTNLFHFQRTLQLHVLCGYLIIELAMCYNARIHRYCFWFKCLSFQSN